MSTLRCLLIDNYDSYTYNLHNILAEVNGGELQLRPLRNCRGARTPLRRGGSGAPPAVLIATACMHVWRLRRDAWPSQPSPWWSPTTPSACGTCARCWMKATSMPSSSRQGRARPRAAQTSVGASDTMLHNRTF